ncbi:MFS transporter [Mycobacterium montefiorense]|uniref:MFS transporter n=1 Tax=Mycobacterium montefiorense TaxID=154654 RepID=A0AA37PP21_9MYCO|nr:MFS transporter [Mycobacterium montefiorense]GKU35001.1 MFS transporter [Mycobacterium montefiorense]GKU41012.1 MFS transporter [Mycobacterium montefiorense]GKU47123.1 MFS transporter [Mycobacterium montefiorense]GKU49243.1 MFS transporter [Mycobacterium montefiorense]
MDNAMTLDAQTLSAKSRSERGMLLVLSAVAGVIVSGLFLIEPLLGAIARQFGVSMGIAVLPVVAAQVGFAFALAFGALVIDHVEQRALLAALLVLSTIALVGVGLAPGFWWAVVAMGGVGISATAALVAVRLVANFADGQYPGRAVGVVMPGLLVGISASGTAGGLIAAELSWRDVFMVAAGVQLALSMIVVEIIPAGAPASARRSYAAFAPSVSRLIALSPMLRGRTLLPFLATPGFITVWASTAFALAGLGSANYRFSEPVVGLAGAFGAAGAPGVSGVDHFADRDHARTAITAACTLIAAGWWLFVWDSPCMDALVPGLLIFGLGVKVVQLSDQQALYAAQRGTRSVSTTVNSAALCAAAVTGSLLSGLAYQTGRWPALCALGAGNGVVGLLMWALIAADGRRTARPRRKYEHAVRRDRGYLYFGNHVGLGEGSRRLLESAALGWRRLALRAARARSQPRRACRSGR